MNYRISPPEEILETTVELPGSKSIEARALVMSFIFGGVYELAKHKNTSECVDTDTLRNILLNFGNGGQSLNVGASGTAMRFMTALCASTPGSICRLEGSERMSQRPIGALVDALRCLGAEITYLGQEGYPPLEIHGKELSGGNIEIDAAISSQFISALMMIAPKMKSALRIRFKTEVSSFPYIKMTAAMMNHRGVNVTLSREEVFVENKTYREIVDDSEPDWSAATFWYELTSLTAGWVTIRNLKSDSLQGDRTVATLFERLGVVTEFTEDGAELSATPDLYSRFDADMSDMPDAVPALVVTACMVGIPFNITGVKALRHKESDRLEALRCELLKLGMCLELENDNTITWSGSRMPITEMPVFETYSDHRLAMALAPVAVFVPGIVVKNIEVVEKSYPGYWEALQDAGFVLEEVVEE